MNASVDSVFPEKYRILSGSALKMIAIITMLIDHIGAVILSMYPPHRKSCLRFSEGNTVCILFSAISAEWLFPSSAFSCWKVSGIPGAVSAMDGISFFLLWSQRFPGTWCSQTHCIMKDRMCFSRFSWDTWRFVPSNILRISAWYSFSVSWDCLLFPFFWKQITDGGDIFFSWSCTICETISPGRRSLEAAGFTMNGEPVSPFCPLTCTMGRGDLSTEKRRNISFTGFIQSILWDWWYFDRFYFCLNSFFLIILYGCACCMWKVLRFQFCTFPVGSSEGRKHSELRSPFFSPQAPLFPGTQFGQAPS